MAAEAILLAFNQQQPGASFSWRTKRRSRVDKRGQNMNNYQTVRQEAAALARAYARNGFKAHLCRFTFSGGYFGIRDDQLPGLDARSFEIVLTYDA